MAEFTNDAMQSGLGFVISQTSAVETAVNEQRYPQIQYQDLVPVDISAPEWAKTITYFSSDKIGAANWINGKGDDIPVANIQREKFETPVYMAGIGYEYGLEEVMQAQMLGINLPNEDAVAARRGYEEFVDGIAMTGNTAKNVTGLINDAGVSSVTVINGSWDVATVATGAEVMADINKAMMAIGTGTQYTVTPNTLLLPPTSYQYIASTPMTTASDTTILKFLQENNVWTLQTGQPLTIRAVRQLETAGTGPSKRLVTYFRSPEVLKIHIPMIHRFLPVQIQNLTYKVPGIFRLGKLDVRRPGEIKYMDAI